MLALGAILLAAVPPLGGAHAADPASPQRPSIVLILTDDQRYDSLWAMPTVQRELLDQGVRFTRGFVVNSLCCPSRAAILTGQYSHSNGVYTNNPPRGGFSAFRPHEHSTIATWLQKGGYTTALIGKYFNHYDKAGKAGYVPPGWNHWDGLAVGAVGYYNYALNVDGRIEQHHHSAADYSTDVLTRKAVDVIHQTKGPLFLYLAPSAPHAPANPAPRDVNAFPKLKPYRPPAYDESDVSDKPAWVRSLPRYTSTHATELDTFHRRQYQSLLAVDREVAQVIRALRDTHRLHNTMIVFTSDNGIAWGEHRWSGKKDAYEESIRVPMVVRYDPMTSQQRTLDSHLVLNIDLAPTFAQLGGVTAPNADGKSFLPLLDHTASSWRTDFLIEHLRDKQAPIPTFCAVRGTRYLYVQYQDGEEELYDLNVDPNQLDNRASAASEAAVLAHLRGRTKQLCKPAPPGFTMRSPPHVRPAGT
jgi:arylsulfatase A-like enzyme